MAQASRTFRIFVSSTFDDLKEERNALQKHVFPKLRELCMKHGCRFQAIDLRWGVSEEAALDQQTMKICREEIARCQQISPQPNFIVLLGDRYGWCPLPYEIPTLEFSEILHNVTNAEDTELLSNWYRCDDNAVPPVYDLQPRTEEYVESANWQPIERRLHSILNEAVRNMALSEEDQNKYWASATEQEIRRGALTVDNASDHVFCFFRTINNLPQDQSPKKYFDLDEAGNPDLDARHRLVDLKSRLEHRLPNNNIFRYEAKWIESGASSDYLNQLCDDALRSLTQIIEQEIAGLEETDPLDEEIDAHETFGKERTRTFTGREDILTAISDYIIGPSISPYVIHGESGSGKTALMAKTVERAREGCPEAKVFCRFIGATPESSDGRSLLERLCNQIYHTFDFENQKQRKLEENKKDDKDAQQRRQKVEREYEIPTDFQKLSPTFRSFLSKIPSQEKLILFIDALDQLADTDQARSLTWLPSGLPQNIRVIVSTLPGECFSILERRLPENKLKELESMPLAEGTDLLKSWLKAVGRTLQNNQMKEVLDKFTESGLPFYLKLAFEESRRWKSYTQRVDLSPDIPGIIRDFFEQLSSPANHGKVLVSHSLGYLAASKNGLTEDELLDVLSSDKTVFKDFADRAHHDPTEAKLPVIVWLRLYNDLEPYLKERRADRTSVLSFYHMQLSEVVVEKFLTNEAKRRHHKGLEKYFKNQSLWFEKSGKMVPNQRKVSELPYQQMHGELWDELRQTLASIQFVETKCFAGLTYDLIADYSSAIDALPESQKLVTLEKKNQKRMETYIEKIIAYSKAWNNAMGRFYADSQNYVFPSPNDIPIPEPPSSLWVQIQNGEKSKYRESEYSRLEHLKAWMHFVSNNTEAICRGEVPLFQVAYNSVNGGPITKAADEYIKEKVSYDEPWLCQINRPFYEPNPSCDRTLIGHRRAVSSVAITADGHYAVSGSADNTLRVWDLKTGQCLKTLQGHTEGVTSVSITPDGRSAVSASYDNTVRLWDLVNEECIRTFADFEFFVHSVVITPDGKQALLGLWPDRFNKGLQMLDLDKEQFLWKRVSDIKIDCVALSYNGMNAAYGGKHDRRICHTCVYDISGKFSKTISVRGDCFNAIALKPDGRRIVWSDGGPFLRLLDAETKGWKKKDHIKILMGHSGAVSSVAITADGHYAVSGSADNTLRVWDLETGQCLKTLQGHTEGVTSVSITPDGRLAISGSLDSTLRLWDLSKNQHSYTQKVDQNIGEVLAIINNGRHVISKRWNYSSHRPENDLDIWNIYSERKLKTPKLLKPDLIVTTAVMSDDIRRAVIGGYYYINTKPNTRGGGKKKLEKTMVWDIENQKPIHTFDGHTEPFWAVILTPDNRYVISTSKDATIRVWDIETGHCIKALEGHTDSVSAVALTPAGNISISGSKDTTLRVWDIKTGRCLKILEGHTNSVISVSVTPDGRKAISGSKDTTLRVWDIKTGRCLKILEGHTNSVISTSVTSDGYVAVSGSHDNTMRMWDLRDYRCLAIHYSVNGDIVKISNFERNFICALRTGKIDFFRLENYCTGPVITTAIRKWLFGRSGETGKWDNNVTAICSLCNNRFIIPSLIFQSIKKIKTKPKISRSSHCSKHYAETWNDPRLMSECSNCHTPLKFNPFIVDNSEQY